MTKEYSYNYDILCAACNKPRYFGYTDLPDSKMCCCHGQDKIPTYDKRLGITEEALMYATQEEWDFYNKCIEGLPTMAGANGDGKDKNDEYIPYGSGPHLIKYFKEAVEIVKPESILEIGFCCGAGAAMLLALSEAYIYSIEKSDRDETIKAACVLTERYKKEVIGIPTYRFNCLVTDSKDAFQYLSHAVGTFTMAWIDGGHEEPEVTADIELCKQLKIHYLLFDDIFDRFGPGVLPAIAKYPELDLVKDMNNLRLYKVNY
jgi:methyltransferase family protein